MKIWSVIYPILLYYVGCSIGSLFFPIVVPMVVGACVIFPMFRREYRQLSLQTKDKMVWKKDVPLLLIFGGAATLFFNILFALLQITGSSQQYAEVAERQFAFPLWVGILLYGVVSPLAEEMVFRGIVYNRLKRFFNNSIAIIGSAVLFGVYHGNIVQASYGFLLGMLIAFFYERYGSFAVPVLLHSIANVSVYVISDSVVLQSILMNWTACVVCGILTFMLFWMLVLRKNKELD